MEIISHVRFLVPEYKEVPPELIEKWRLGSRARAAEINRLRKKMVKTPADFQEKIAQPLIRGFAKALDAEYVSRSGLPARAIIEHQKSGWAGADQKYFKKLRQMYQTVDGVKAKRYLEAVDRAAADYGRGATKYLFPWSGYHGLGPGVASLAARWLTGNPKVKNELRPTDEIIQGEPVLVTTPEQAGRFRRSLRNRLIQLGPRAMRAIDVDPVVIDEGNQIINALVQRFAQPEFVPFRPGSDSHLDFIIHVIRDPAEPRKSAKRLYLEIQVANLN